MEEKDIIKKQTETTEIAQKIIDEKQKLGLEKKNISSDIHDSNHPIILSFWKGGAWRILWKLTVKEEDE